MQGLLCPKVKTAWQCPRLSGRPLPDRKNFRLFLFVIFNHTDFSFVFRKLQILFFFCFSFLILIREQNFGPFVSTGIYIVGNFVCTTASWSTIRFWLRSQSLFLGCKNFNLRFHFATHFVSAQNWSFDKLAFTEVKALLFWCGNLACQLVWFTPVSNPSLPDCCLIRGNVPFCAESSGTMPRCPALGLFGDQTICHGDDLRFSDRKQRALQPGDLSSDGHWSGSFFWGGGEMLSFQDRVFEKCLSGCEGIPKWRRYINVLSTFLCKRHHCKNLKTEWRLVNLRK